jgi:hypothetical protein
MRSAVSGLASEHSTGRPPPPPGVDLTSIIYSFCARLYGQRCSSRGDLYNAIVRHITQELAMKHYEKRNYLSMPWMIQSGRLHGQCDEPAYYYQR